MFYMFLAEGFEEVEALSPLDLLRRAGIEVRTVGIGGRLIRGSHGIGIEADMTDAEYTGAGLEGVILPGGMPGTRNLDASETVDAALRAAFDGGKYICAICAAPSVPGRRGMLAGRRAVCFPGFEDTLKGALHTGARVERDGMTVTAVGMGAAVEFGLEIVAAVKGEAAAKKLASSVLAPGSRS